MTIDPELLFRPFQFRNLHLPNRLAMAPMTRSRCPGGVPGPEVADYYRRRTAGDIGLIITEGVLVNHPAASGYPDCPNLYTPEALTGWRELVATIHQAGGCVVPQLWHVGMQRQPGMGPDPTVPGYGPSALTMGNEVPAVALTLSEIGRIIEAFAEAAANAREVGFDGVEIHGAHGYLIDQFFWERTNQRTDWYGGSFTNRLRFAVEVIRAVRQAVGADFPVIFRFSQWKPADYTARLAPDPAALERWLLPLAEAGVDIFHASSRRYWEPEFPGSTLNLAGWTRRITGKPTITVGCVGLDDVRWDGANTSGIDDLLSRLAREEFDLVAVGRALLADPAWAAKVRRGAWAEIQPYTKEALQRLV